MKRVVLVTGACGGIGSVLTKRFVEAGDHVLALDRKAEALAAFVESLGTTQVTPAQRTQTCQQLIEVEGLYQIIVGAIVEPADAIGNLVACRQD